PMPSCDCIRLTHVLRTNETLPDHFHMDAARLSCKHWLMEHWHLAMTVDLRVFPEAVEHFRYAPAGASVVALHAVALPKEITEKYKDVPPKWSDFVSIPLASGVFVQCADPTTWPLPLVGVEGHLLLVIRQDVEEPPDGKLARALEENPDWLKVLEH